MNSIVTHSNKKNQWSPLFRLNHFDEVIENLMGESGWTQNGNWQPACDVIEGKDHYWLTLEAAGVPKDQIKIEVHEQKLTIAGEKKFEEFKNEKGFMYSERSYGKFLRTFTLPPGLDADKIEANYQDGVLKIAIPKGESSKPKEIRIGTGKSEG